MSHKKVTIALILKIPLGFDSRVLKLDHDIENKFFWSLSIKLLTLFNMVPPPPPPPPNVIYHCAQPLSSRKLKLGDF